MRIAVPDTCVATISASLSASAGQKSCSHAASLSFSFHATGEKLLLPLRRRNLLQSDGAPGLISASAVSDDYCSSNIYLISDANSSVIGIILGGGAGTRLHPLTMKRAKPAVPLGANYRLIDIPVSNCLNSNISKIYVLTQYNSVSLNRHIMRAYASNIGMPTNKGFVEALAAQQSRNKPSRFEGNADAVRQYMWLFQQHNVMDYLVLAGDHLYRMDYCNFIAAHREVDADITVAAVPTDEKRATAFGLMKIDDAGRVIEFAEKPEGEKLNSMKVQAH